jgi:hypothetical protein
MKALSNTIYFVAETKGSMSSMQLRLIEESKIHCAREHFRAISGDNVVYDVVDSYTSLLEKSNEITVWQAGQSGPHFAFCLLRAMPPIPSDRMISSCGCASFGR